MEKEFYENNYGVRICKCCASCTNKEFRGEGRFCSIRKHKVDNSDVCSLWQVNGGLENAGSVHGSVKDIRYMNFMLNNFLEESHKAEIAKGKGEKYTPKAPSYFMAKWLETHDTIYLIP